MDATAEFDMIRPPDVIEKDAPDVIIGQFGAGGVAAHDDDDDDDDDDDEEEAAADLPACVKGYSKEEVAKHTSKRDCWVILHGKVLNVTNFLSQHPGGDVAILTFAGKDATAEFDMIHPRDVVGKYAPDAIIGVVSGGKKNWVSESWDDNPSVFLINVKAFLFAGLALLFNFVVAVLIFLTHAVFGLQRVSRVLGNASLMGCAIVIVLGLIYISG